MPADVTKEEFQALEQEVEGEKLVTRHILEQTRRNGDDLAAVKTRLDRVEEKVDRLDKKVDRIDGRLDHARHRPPFPAHRHAGTRQPTPCARSCGSKSKKQVVTRTRPGAYPRGQIRRGSRDRTPL